MCLFEHNQTYCTDSQRLFMGISQAMFLSPSLPSFSRALNKNTQDFSRQRYYFRRVLHPHKIIIFSRPQSKLEVSHCRFLVRTQCVTLYIRWIYSGQLQENRAKQLAASLTSLSPKCLKKSNYLPQFRAQANVAQIMKKVNVSF